MDLVFVEHVFYEVTKSMMCGFALLYPLDKALHNFTIHSRNVRSQIECSLWCLRHQLCRSFNYQNEAGKLHICELNNETALTMPRDLVHRTGFAYFDFGMVWMTFLLACMYLRFTNFQIMDKRLLKGRKTGLLRLGEVVTSWFWMAAILDPPRLNWLASENYECWALLNA